MAESSAPPPYKTVFQEPSSELPRRNFHFHASNKIDGAEMQALREQIRENAPTLFALAFGAERETPAVFRINTMIIPHGEDAGKSQAFITFKRSARISPEDLGVFVVGYPATGPQMALRALLEKMDGMMGRMWWDPLQRKHLGKGEALLRSIDE